MAGMFEELYQDPYEKIEQSARANAALGSWGSMAASAGLAGGMLGRAGSKLLGATYEEDLVADILKGGDHESEEGRAAVLSQLSSVSPGAFMKVQGMYQEMQEGKLKLRETEAKVKAKEDKPAKEKYWRDTFQPNFTQSWANDAFMVSGIKSRTDLVKFLNKQVQAGKMKTGERSTWLKDYDKAVKDTKSQYDTSFKLPTAAGTATGNIVSGFAPKINPSDILQPTIEEDKVEDDTRLAP